MRLCCGRTFFFGWLASAYLSDMSAGAKEPVGATLYSDPENFRERMCEKVVARTKCNEAKWQMVEEVCLISSHSGR